MENFIRWFKTSPIYYWFVLIILPSIKYAFFASEIQGRVMDLLFTLIAAVLIIVFSGNLDFSSIEDSIRTGGFLLGVVLIFRFVYSLLRLPADMYFSEKNQADRFTFNNIHAQIITLDKGYGIKVINEKVYDIKSTLMGIL